MTEEKPIPLRVGDLIRYLSQLPNETLVLAWKDGDRYEINAVDYFEEEKFVDLNLTPDP